jgi:acyl-CoA thioester hydrolase
MTFHYYHPIEVRYGDIDGQGHVNNAKYLTYLEQARVGYVMNLGLWAADSFLDVGMILADAQITFRAPILLGQPIRVGVHVSRLGTKSFDMTYVIEDQRDARVLATAKTVQVSYDYRTEKTVPIPDVWRQAVAEFEQIQDN